MASENRRKMKIEINGFPSSRILLKITFRKWSINLNTFYVLAKSTHTHIFPSHSLRWDNWRDLVGKLWSFNITWSTKNKNNRVSNQKKFLFCFLREFLFKSQWVHLILEWMVNYQSHPTWKRREIYIFQSFIP